MKIYAAYMDEAWLLGADGTVISVMNHPSADFEFDSILYVLSEYGSDRAKTLVDDYNKLKDESIKNSILSVYDNTWCKVRVWESGRLIIFRITSTNSFNWYKVITEFLMDHPSYKNSKITVETDKRTGVRRTYWDEVTYAYALSPENESIFATKQLID